jgi:hypothetical protein
LRIKADGHLEADRLIDLAKHSDGPGGSSLVDGKVVLAAGLAGDDGTTVPLVVEDQSHAGQGIACGVDDAADDADGASGAAGTGL